MGDFDACRFDFRLDAKNGLMPSKRRKTERIQPSNYSTLFKCKICGTLFTCRMLLLEHKMTHSEYRYNKCKYECGLCGDRKFSRKDHLRDHLIREHQLDDVKVAEVMGEGRMKHAIGRKSRGSLNRKSDCTFRKSVLKRAPKSSTPREDDVKDTSQVVNDCVSATKECSSALGCFQSSSVALDSAQTQATFGENVLPPNYLYINFPILIAPPTTSNSNDPMARLHPMTKNDLNWSASSLPVDLAQRIKVEIDDRLTSQSRATTSQTGSIFDLPNALSRFLAYNNYVTSRRNDADEPRGDGPSEASGGTQPFNFFTSAIRRDLEHDDLHHRSVAAATLNDFDDGRPSGAETVLDFSLKTSNHLPCNNKFTTVSENSSHQNDTGSQSELDDVVDLSRKSRFSDQNARRSSEVTDRRKDDDYRTGRWSAPWNLDNSRSSTTLTLPSDSPVNHLGLLGVMETKRSSIRSAAQASTNKGKSVLNKTVEKLWKNKIGRISDTANTSTLEVDCDSIDFVREADEICSAKDNLEGSLQESSRFSEKPWNFSLELPPEVQPGKRVRGFYVTPELLQPINDIDDEGTRKQFAYRQFNNGNFVGSSIADEEEEEEEEGTGKQENEVIDLTTTTGSKRGSPFDSDSQPDRLVLSNRTSSTNVNFSAKDQSSACPTNYESNADSLNVRHSRHSFNQLIKDCEISSADPKSSRLEIPPTLTCSSEESLDENSSVLWTNTTTHSEGEYKTTSKSDSKPTIELIEDDDEAGSQGQGFESYQRLSNTNADAVHRPRRNDHRLNCGYPQCGKTFKEWRHLKVHLTLHTGEKPLSCYLCKYTCRHRSSMNWHMKTKHRMEKSKIQGNRTVYVDASGATEFIRRGKSEAETETRILQLPEANPEKRDDLTASGDEKELTFLNELRNSLSLFANGLKSTVLQQHVVQMESGNDVTLADNSFVVTEDGKPEENLEGSEVALSVSEKQENEIARSEVSSDESLPQLLLKKVTASPGKDPKFYTSLMHIKYAKHPSKPRGQQQSPKRKASAAKREDPTGHRCATCDHACVAPAWNHGDDSETQLPYQSDFIADNQLELHSQGLSDQGSEIEEPKNHPCSIGDKAYSSKPELNQNLQRPKADVTVQCTCPLVNCGQKFAGNAALRHHMKSVHPDTTANPPGDKESDVSLQDTEPRSSTPSLPPVGVSAPLVAQTDERPVACDYPGCDKSFRELKHLKVHQMQHTDEKPLRCLICDYSCRQRNSMNWHMKSKHGQEKHVTNDGRTIYI